MAKKKPEPVQSDSFMHGSPEYNKWLAEDREREDAEAAKAQAEADAADAAEEAAAADAAAAKKKNGKTQGA